jgi:N-acetylmuramoyl-L-alanine amidase
MSLLLYLGKVLLASALLFGYYRLFLRNRQFHHYNRFYLLGALLLSVVLPLCKIPVMNQPHNVVSQAVYQAADVLTVDYGEDESGAAGSGWQTLVTIPNCLYLLYAMGMAFLLLQVGRSLVYIRSITRRYPVEMIRHLKFYNTREPGTPFSFFHAVFWNEQLAFNSPKGQQIFRHELFHVKQKHTFDILLAELITALFWFNPFFHLMKKEIKAIHEFLADQYAVSGSDRYAYAELLVQQTLDAKRIPLAHPFFQNHIKRRVAMITQLNQPKYRYWSRVMILPLAILLFCGIALYARQPDRQFSNAEPFLRATESVTIVVDPGHGGTDPGAQTNDGKIIEKDLNLQIAKQVQQLAQQYNIHVILTREGDYLPGDATDVKQGLANRTDLVNNVKPKLFISIHAAAAPHANKNFTGMEVYITSKNEAIAGQSAKLGSALLGNLTRLYTVNPAVMKRKEAGIWVLDKSPVPAVLLECGYITNEKDAGFLTNENNQQKIARGILQGVTDYLNADAQAAIITDTVPAGINKQAAIDTAMKSKLRENDKKQQQLVQQIQQKQQELENLQKELADHQQQLSPLQKKQLLLAELNARADAQHQDVVLQKLQREQELLTKLKQRMTEQELQKLNNESVLKQKMLLQQLQKERNEQAVHQKQLLLRLKKVQDNKQTKDFEVIQKKLYELKSDLKQQHRIDSVQQR